MTIMRIGITTGGGDAPGLNAVIRAVVLASEQRGWQCVGIREGYDGLINPAAYPQGGLIKLDRDAVRGIAHLGGTILGTTNRGDPFGYQTTDKEGNATFVDRSDHLKNSLEVAGINAVVSIGGDGSMSIANRVHELGVRVIGVPKTIDNDLAQTVATFGFDTAVAYATDAIGRLHTTAASHRRVMVVEVMGRYAGWIALHSGIAASADVILIPEIPYNLDRVVNAIQHRNQTGRRFSIVVVAEGARPVGGDMSFREIGGVKRLSGVGRGLAELLRGRVPNEVRTVVLGHLLRGGSPTARDRLLALRFGAAAVRALDEGHSGVMVALDPPTVRYVPLEQCTDRIKTVSMDCDTMFTARDLGTCFGD